MVSSKKNSRAPSNPHARNLWRRDFLRFVAASPLLSAGGACAGPTETVPAQAVLPDVEGMPNVFAFEPLARSNLTREVYDFVTDGSDDQKTLAANREAFDLIQIRARRLVDVSEIDTSVDLFGLSLKSPIVLAPVGIQGLMHAEGEVATARAAAGRGHLLVAPTLSSLPIARIGSAGGPLWFQLYPTDNRRLTQKLLEDAEAAGCRAVALTVDTPVTGNRESQNAMLSRMLQEKSSFANFGGFDESFQVMDASLTWDFVRWLREHTSMKLVLKGIVTSEDATLAVEHGVDGLIVSNHGGRQEESNRATIECLDEVLAASSGRLPVLIDGGFRRGTDVFKALAMGARAVAVGRPYIWGLAAFGKSGIEKVLDILQAELVRIMRLSGAPSLSDITTRHVNARF